MKNKLVVLSLDALQTNDLDLFLTLPYAAQWRKRAAVVRNVREIYPTLTYPIHTTLITGVRPEVHGIIHNQKASITPEVPDFSLMGSDWYWQKEAIRVRTLADAVFDDGRTAAMVNWPVTAGEKRGWNLPEIWPVKAYGEDPRQVYQQASSDNVFERYYDAFVGRYDWKSNDDLVSYGGEIALDILKRERPDLMLYHAVHMDHTRHVYGDAAPETQDCLKTLDILVHRIVEAADDGHTNFVILGDHGQIDVKQHFFLNNALRDAGLIRVNADGKPVSYDAYAFSAGFSAHIYLRDPKDAALIERVGAVLDGIHKAFPQYIDRVYTAKEAHEEEGLSGAFSFVVEGSLGTILSGTLGGEAYLLRADEPDYALYRAMHGHHPAKGNKPPFIAFGPDVRAGVVLDGADMLDICPTLARLAGVTMEGLPGKPLDLFR